MPGSEHITDSTGRMCCTGRVVLVSSAGVVLVEAPPSSLGRINRITEMNPSPAMSTRALRIVELVPVQYSPTELWLCRSGVPQSGQNLALAGVGAVQDGHVLSTMWRSLGESVSPDRLWSRISVRPSRRGESRRVVLPHPDATVGRHRPSESIPIRLPAVSCSDDDQGSRNRVGPRRSPNLNGSV